jgi:hypothetical protein
LVDFGLGDRYAYIRLGDRCAHIADSALLVLVALLALAGDAIDAAGGIRWIVVLRCITVPIH